MLKERLV